MHWNDEIQYLKGVGPQRAAKLAKLGVKTAGQLLCLYPRNYVDYSSPVEIALAPFNTPCVVRAEVISKQPPLRTAGGRTLFKVCCADDTAMLTLAFFNNEFTVKKLEIGKEYVFYGKVTGGIAKKDMASPQFISAQAGKQLTAVYPLTEGLSSLMVGKCACAALELVQDIPEPLPEWMLEKYHLPSKKEALQGVHAPGSMQDVAAAHRRLVFEELLVLQLGMLRMRGREIAETGAPMRKVSMEDFWKNLPFKPTGAQVRSVEEITKDMMEKSPMNRLLQGDVGSGKTLVAAAGIYFAAQNGYQSVLMAPTEILAQQHAETMEKSLAPLGLKIRLLTGSVKATQRKLLLEEIKTGEVDLVVGTHAVISEPVEFKNLGFTVTDEQHRFGVRQRGQLAAKAKRPHLLVMSATPIPRTLALLMFGDLDVSVLNEMPPGRMPVKTRAISVQKREAMFGFLAQKIEEGQQVYIVCPLIEEGENSGELQKATDYAKDIARPLLPNAKVGIMHGRLKPKEKAEVMRLFRENELDVLVSTTVIEVGVDVPNATVMVIEDAERYGLSALHQLRGRVGRGTGESWCFLVSDHTADTAKERLRFLSHTADGFEVAKYDLENRGPGDFFGSRQHGLPTLQIANLATDTRVLKAAQEEALGILRDDPILAKDENAGLASAVETMFEKSMVMN